MLIRLLVLIRNSFRNRGPYRIHRVLPNDGYVIRDIDGCQLTQLPYDGVIEASRIRKWIDLR